jgi:hypothetical protein
MTMAANFTALMTTWGQTVTVARRSVTYGDTGKPSSTWATNDTQASMIQPFTRRGDAIRREPGLESSALYEIYMPAATSVRAGDRIRPAGWTTGANEYDVIRVESYSPSHLEVVCRMTEGDGGS